MKWLRRPSWFALLLTVAGVVIGRHIENSRTGGTYIGTQFAIAFLFVLVPDSYRAVDAEAWRRVLPQVRAAAVGLARAGRLVITRHGKPADPDSFKGVYRLRLP